MIRLLVSAGAVILGALSLFIAGGELALRVAGYSAPIWYEPDLELGWRMRAGAQGWFTKEGRAHGEVNAAGFRDRAYALAKPANTYRFAVLGDSAVEAFQVEFESTFWRQLEARMRRCPALGGRGVEVLAFAVSGYGTAQEYLMLKSIAMRYEPDFVLLTFAANDLRNNSERLEPENERPFFLPDGEGLSVNASFVRKPAFVTRSSALYEAYRDASDWLRMVQLVQAARHGFDAWRKAGAAHANTAWPGIEPTTVVTMFAPPREPTWEETWVVTERLIARMAAVAARGNARFALTMQSHSAQVHPDPATRRNLQNALGVPDLFYVERRLQALAEREGFPMIALAPEMQKRAEAERIHFHGFDNYRVGWGHWNAEGHRAAAEILAPALCAAL